MKNVIRTTVLLAAAAGTAALTGCAATVVHNAGAQGAPAVKVPAESSKEIVLNVSGTDAARSGADWAGFRGEVIRALAAEAGAENVRFSPQDGPVEPQQGKPGTLISFEVSDYHWVSTGARFGLGIMTGNAYVKAKVRYLDLSTGRPFGEETIDTTSSAWQGVFAPMTDKQLAAIAKEVVTEVHPR